MWKKLSSIKLSLSTLVVSSALLATACSPTTDKLIISGTNNITTYVNEYHEEAIIGKWSVSGTHAEQFRFDNVNDYVKLVWSSSAFSQAEEFDLTIKCVAANHEKSKVVHFSIEDFPLPPMTSITIYGSDVLTGVEGASGLSKYTAIDNNGHAVNNGNWVINTTSGCDNVSVNNYGEVDWADDATSGTFALSCTLNGVTGTSGTITLIIGSDPIPTPTSITIYGSQDLTGVGGYSGLSDYTATDNNGHILVGCTWTIENQTCSGVTVNGNGQVRWTDKATSGTFDLRCTKSGLSDGVLTGIAIDITNPLPPGPGPMPTSCLEKSSDGKTCYGIRAGTDLSLYSEIDIPEGVEIIVSNSFSGRISSGYSYALKLPNSIATIGDYAFYECHGLHEIYFGSNYQQTLGKDVFMDYGYSPNGLKKIVASFQQQPNWGSSARNEFTNANDNGTVENLDSRYSSSSFLFYLEVVCCLPQTWRAIA